MKKIISLVLILLSVSSLFAHPMPNSVLLLDVNSEALSCELQLPLPELQYAVSFDVAKNPQQLLQTHQKELSNYILSHFKIKGESGKNWNVQLLKMSIKTDEQEATGAYKELVAILKIVPKSGDQIRQFTIHYDGIAHQVITHKILVAIRQDWENGKIENEKTEVGTIQADINTTKVPPFKVNLSSGSNWKGFQKMVQLGLEHIAEGTDHLLFLLVLLLSAPLIAENNNWVKSGNTRYSLIRILKIVTAFTLGHSITLIIGSFGLLHPNTRWVEILIAFSILITAFHAIKPIFPKKEIFVAAGFGLIHGMAFATILSNLNLAPSKLALSLLGFNIGIELMQLFVILLVMPWFLLLSPYPVYKIVRIAGAVLAGIASLAWMFERITGTSNFITIPLEDNSNYSIWIISGLALFAISYKTIFKLRNTN